MSGSAIAVQSPTRSAVGIRKFLFLSAVAIKMINYSKLSIHLFVFLFRAQHRMVRLSKIKRDCVRIRSQKWTRSAENVSRIGWTSWIHKINHHQLKDSNIDVLKFI